MRLKFPETDSTAPLLVSVILPVYNGERYLAEAIESVLSQTFRSREVVIVDDGSTDGSSRVVEHYGEQVRSHSQPHRGLGAARNTGVALSSGRYISFIDADDLWFPDKLSRQMAVFDQSPDIDMVFTHIRQFVTEDAAREVSQKYSVATQAMPGYLASTLLVTRKAFLGVGKFSPDWRVGEFVDWYARAHEKGLRSQILPDVLVRRRVHGANMGIQERASRGDYARILKLALDRRRSGRSK